MSYYQPELTNLQKNNINPLPNMVGGTRIFDNSAFYNLSTGVQTTHFKIESEAPFHAVRVWYGERNTTGTPGTFQALVAPTETMARTTTTIAWLPIKGGTAYNSLASSNNGPGWNPVTWNSSSSMTPTLTTGSNSATYNVSDWIPCTSLPRTDVVGGRPACLLRLAQTNGSGAIAFAGGDTTPYYGGRGQNWYREFLVADTANDGVNTIGNFPPITQGGNPQYAWLEFAYDAPCRNVVIVGDSTLAGVSSSTGYNPWGMVGLIPLSTQTAPISVMNLAGSSHSPAQYLALLDGCLNAGMLPTDIIWQGWSVNGFTPQNPYGASLVMTRNIQYLQKLRAKGIRVWMTTAYGSNGYAGAAELARIECANYFRKLAANGLINLLETDQIITDYSGGNGVITTAYDSGDHVHANATGQTLLSNLLASVWN